MDKIIVVRYGKGYKAYREQLPETFGTGRSQPEAIGALYNYIVGGLILENPAKFGFELDLRPTA